MNVLFLNYYDFTSNSAVHIFNLANELTGLGLGCAVAVPGDPATIARIGEPRFQVLDFRSAKRGALRFPDGGQPTLVHTWTPREVVRELAQELVHRHSAPYVVHLEDNEDVISADSLGITLEQLRAMPAHELDAAIPWHRSHPVRMRRFLAGAAGITVIVDPLLEFRTDGVPAETIWPAYEPELFSDEPPELELRRRLGIAEGESVLVYAGNAHPSNAAEMRSLYLAVGAVNRSGRPLRLVRLGRDYVQFLERELRALEAHVIRVPDQPRSEVSRYMRLADVLVQPGRPGGFNDYRFPSKLPEFLATGRPVVLPESNLGRHLEDGVECILLQRGDALEIAAAIERLLDDDELRASIGRAGRAFAERSFSWARSAQKLQRFYERVLASGRPLDHERNGSQNGLARIRERRNGTAPPRLGYATVRDYCDSVERMPYLATTSHDLKDVQRPWALKTIATTVEPGSRLLEIGAGEPVVAGMLSRLGYAVTVVDPYDGRDGGPRDAEAIVASFPDVRIVRGVFPDDVDDDEPFDCVYSISVLEHIPTEAVDAVCVGIERRVRGGGRTIHAIDHVLRGPGDEEHRRHLGRIIASFGIAESELDETLSTLADDPETYFLSAEGHNRWRAGMPYDEFPMRRCVSIQLCVPIGGA
jgi:glycosyltransferase involved in cell wall biosynthesis